MARRARTYRLDEGLIGRLEVRAAELGQSHTVFVVRALEAALGDDQVEPVGEAVRVAPARPASPRASEPPLDSPKQERPVSKAEKLEAGRQVLQRGPRVVNEAALARMRRLEKK